MAGSPLLDVGLGKGVVQASHVFFAVSASLIALAMATFAVRIEGLRRRRCQVSDLCMVFGFVLALAQWALLVPQACIRNPDPSSPPTIEAGKCAYIAIAVWGLAMTAIKTSVGLALLRIQPARWFQILMWIDILLVSVYGFANLWFTLFQCEPLRAAWLGTAHIDGARCLGAQPVELMATVGSAIAFTTDLILSLAPITFLWNLQRPMKERVVVGCLMGLGIFAAAATVIKMVMIGQYSVTSWAQTVNLGTCTTVEQFLGIIAGCIPFCKPLFQQCLGLMGLSLTPSSSPTEREHTKWTYQSATAQDTFSNIGSCQSPLSAREADIDAVELWGGDRSQGGRAVLKSTEPAELGLQFDRTLKLHKGCDGFWRPGTGDRSWEV